MGKSRMSNRQRDYEADIVNRLSDNHQLNQAQQRISSWTTGDRALISVQLSHRTKARLKSSY